MNKTHAKTDSSRNRLYIKIVGTPSRKEVESLYTDIRFCAADLAEGFDVITDLRDCSLVPLGGMTTYMKIVNFLVSNKVTRVVRILNRNSLLFRQIINLADRIQDYQVTVVYSLEEAEAELENSTQSSS